MSLSLSWGRSSSWLGAATIDRGQAGDVIFGWLAALGARRIAGVHDRGAIAGVVEAKGVAEFVEGNALQVDLGG